MSFSYRSRRGSVGFSKPVEVGKEYEAEIVAVSHRGDAGIAKIQGFVIFIPNTKVGDHVKIRITRVGRNFANAEVV